MKGDGLMKWEKRSKSYIYDIQKYLFSMKLKRLDKDFWMHRKHRILP